MDPPAAMSCPPIVDHFQHSLGGQTGSRVGDGTAMSRWHVSSILQSSYDHHLPVPAGCDYPIPYRHLLPLFTLLQYFSIVTSALSHFPGKLIMKTRYTLHFPMTA
uniref:Uncharacterized protein n=1 Tax=Setaria digitata TaxID=48799 RepID=A0A915PI56_9BILA